MREMKKKYTILTILMLVLPTLFSYLVVNNTASSSYPTATLSIDPLDIEQQVGFCFEVNITVTNATNLKYFRIELTYQTEILKYQDYTINGSMLNAPKDAYQIMPRVGGFILLNLDWRDETKPQGDSGTLVTLKFEGIKIDSGIIGFTEESLYNSTRGSIIPTVRNGEYNITRPKPPIKLTRSYTLYTDINFGDLGDVFTILADNIVLDLNGHTISNTGGWGCGIEAAGRKNVTIRNGTITNFQYCIKIIAFCDQVNVSNVNISGSVDFAIQAADSRNLRICDSNMSTRQAECLSLSGCSLSEVSHNILSDNKGYGIDMENSNSNTISYNTISNNTLGGIKIKDSSNNTIFPNNFINNTNHVSITDSYKTSINLWNSSYPRGGNFWDDLNDTAHGRIVDQKSGKNQTLPGPDGIGDMPHFINNNNQDEYPLMNPYDSVCPPMLLTHDECKAVSRFGNITTTNCSIAVFSNSWVTDLDFSCTIIDNRATGSINFSLSGGTFCNVIVSKELLDGIVKIEVNGTAMSSHLNLEGDCVFAYFTYSSGNYTVGITGEKVMPIAGDVNGDGKVDIFDIFIVANNYGNALIKPKPNP